MPLDQKREEYVMTDVEVREQHKPLSNFDLARHFIDAIKVIGTGNGAGVLAAGVALNAVSNRHDVTLWIKMGGIVFLVGVIVFVFAFFFIHASVSYFDQMLDAHRRKDIANVRHCSDIASWTMKAAHALAYVGAFAFLIGCLMGLVVLIKF